MVYLDANILIETILPGRPLAREVADRLDQIDTDIAVSVLTVHLVYHFGRKYKVPDDVLEDVLSPNLILALTPEDYQWAKINEKGRDFEDALQVACALRNGCASFMTIDKPLAKSYQPLLSFIVP